MTGSLHQRYQFNHVIANFVKQSNVLDRHGAARLAMTIYLL